MNTLNSSGESKVFTANVCVYVFSGGTIPEYEGSDRDCLSAPCDMRNWPRGDAKTRKKQEGCGRERGGRH